MKFYRIICQRGHCGTGNSMDITFAIAAKNLLEAMDKARRMPAVKHTRMITYGQEITEQEYNDYRKESAYKRLAHGC